MDKKTNEISVEEAKQALIKESQIRNLIYEIRGHQVMLDSDLAMLYHVET